MHGDKNGERESHQNWPVALAPWLHWDPVIDGCYGLEQGSHTSYISFFSMLAYPDKYL